MEIKFNQWTCELIKSHYMDNNRIALQLVDAEDGCPIATASVNLPDAECPEGHTYIKDWSENMGMLHALTSQGIVEDTGEVAITGFVTANLVKVLV
jgi:hypothetical protein